MGTRRESGRIIPAEYVDVTKPPKCRAFIV